MKRVIWMLPLATLAACSSLTPTDDPVYLRLNDIEARMLRMERVFENESLIQLASEMNQLQQQVQELRGQIETLQFETQGQAERQRELYLDVDQRLQALEQAQTAAPGSPSQSFGGGGSSSGASNAGGGAAASGGSAQQRYDRAFELIQARQYEQAATAFSEFLQAFPDSSFSANAQYWLAETYYVRSQFSEALPEFQRVLDEYPRSSKIPDALLKVGYCNYELENLDAARRALREVQVEFPDTTAARLAAQRLEQIMREGG